MHLSPELEARRAEARRLVYDELMALEVETNLAGCRLAPERWARLTRRAGWGCWACASRAPWAGRAIAIEQTLIWEELGKATNGLWNLV